MADCKGHTQCTVCGELLGGHDRIRDLEAQLARAQADSERLARAGSDLLDALDKHATGSFGDPEDTLRAAIDEARNKE